MKRKLRFIILFIIALPAVAFLPLYIARTMTRSQMSEGGDVISWGLRFTTLISYWSDMNYFRPEEKFFVWLGVNCLLASIYALLAAFCIDRIIANPQRRAGRG